IRRHFSFLPAVEIDRDLFLDELCAGIFTFEIGDHFQRVWMRRRRLKKLQVNDRDPGENGGRNQWYDEQRDEPAAAVGRWADLWPGNGLGEGVRVNDRRYRFASCRGRPETESGGFLLGRGIGGRRWTSRLRRIVAPCRIRWACRGNG